MFLNSRPMFVSTASVLAGLLLITGCGKSTDRNSDSSPATEAIEPAATEETAETDGKPTDQTLVEKDATTVRALSSTVPKATCTVSSEDFAKWFASGTVTKDGLVTTADSLDTLDVNCDFYKWSWRMFLWQMSRTQNGPVFNTAPFYDLNDQNELVSNDGTTRRTTFLLRGGKREGVDRTGQAGVISGVLMAQPAQETADGSLVYYAIHVNDVFAYMASGVNSGDLTNVEQFPITAAERDVIVNYAKSAYGVEIGDADSLAMELKSSWIKLNDKMNADDFITITADVPKYTQESDKKWTWDGTSVESDVKLACVGYHLVGSVAGHPEMIWATFEHRGNAPDANFYYVDSDGKVVEQQNWNSDSTPIATNWLFMDGKSKEHSMNQMRMELKENSILATPDKTIGPGNTMRTHPWGGSPVGQTGGEDAAANNTDLLSINHSVTSQLAKSDVRANYFLVGATWTKNGVPGVGFQVPEVAGSKVLANATMETYFQFKNCLACHQGGNLNGLSHIFGAIKPLAKP